MDFKDVFVKGCKIRPTDTSIIMKCKNIDFGHVNWQLVDDKFYDNEQLMFHIIDNIVDINAYDNNNSIDYYNFISKIMRYSKKLPIAHYVFNNGGVNNDSFNDMYGRDKNYKYKQLVEYLTIISLNKFSRHYNIEKYYNVCHMLLLVMKVQRVLPTAVIKHLIIPFVYQN